MKVSERSTTSIASTAGKTAISTSATATGRDEATPPSGARAPAPPQSTWQEAAAVPSTLALLTTIEQQLAALRTQLTTVRAVPGLQLTPLDVAALEAALGVSVPLTAATLVEKVERLASMRVGDIRIPFTPGQLAELQHRALKRGRTVEAEMRAVVDRLQDELFYQGG